MTKKNLYEEILGYKETKENNTFETVATSKRNPIKFISYSNSGIEWDKFYIQDHTDAEEYLERYAANVVNFGTVWTVKATAAPPKEEIEFLYNEDKIIEAAFEHIKSTYSSHYSGQTQPTELIIDSGNGIGFTVGNIIKYAARLGKKDGWNQKDIYKIIHYAVMLSYIVEKENLAS